MGIVIGVDIGGSSTKICGFNTKDTLIEPLIVKSSDPLASFYGAFGKFTQLNHIALKNIEAVMVTGVGSTFIIENPYGLPTFHVPEFDSIGMGGQYLSRLQKALVVSMGTGTAVVLAENGNLTYLGGTGVGGGTVIGLSKLLLDLRSMEHISALANDGDLSKIDLRLQDISNKNIIATLPPDTTASNFGKLSDIASREDIACGIMNMVFESIGMLAVFAARNYHLQDIVLTGNLAILPQASKTFSKLGTMFGMNFIIPNSAQFSPVIGSALTYFITH
ncbi:MAG TPA: type II pantothenate kinase [Clostridiales bacterium]|nr:type II pantothenate kinase [Clostridiales bacterium]